MAAKPKPKDSAAAKADDNSKPVSLQGKRSSSLGFTRLEKNLASMGFFTPSSKKTKGIAKKSISITREIAGKRVEARATVFATEYGLPITADQDKYLALLKLVGDRRRATGKTVENPVTFKSADLLRVLKKRVSTGRNYEEIEEWLKRMTLTGISSDGVVYFAGRKRWASDTFHVFDRAVSFGNELPDGTVADKNYVWLSDWQLENLNNNYVLPVDLDTYVKVKNHIAKALVPLLQIWLYASMQDRRFEKRYEELAQILNIRIYQHLSRIREQLGPSLDELTLHQYLAGWDVAKTMDDRAFKVVFFHGEKFFADHDRRLEKKVQFVDQEAPGDDDVEIAEFGDEIIRALTSRGVGRKAAKRLLKELPSGDEALRVIEWADQEIARKNPANPSGFLVHMIRENVTPPDSFLSTLDLQRLEREGQAERLRDEKLAKLQAEHERYTEEEVRKCVDALPDAEYRKRIEQKKSELQAKFDVFKSCPPETLQESAEKALRRDVEKELALETFENFCDARRRS